MHPRLQLAFGILCSDCRKDERGMHRSCCLRLAGEAIHSGAHPPREHPPCHRGSPLFLSAVQGMGLSEGPRAHLDYQLLLADAAFMLRVGTNLAMNCMYRGI